MILLQDSTNGNIEFYRTDTATDAAIKLTLEQLGIYSHVVTGGDKYEIEACIADAIAHASNKEEQAKVPPFPYKVGDVINFGSDDWEVWYISYEPFLKFDDGSRHYSLTLHLVGGSNSDVVFVNDAQIRSKGDDE